MIKEIDDNNIQIIKGCIKEDQRSQKDLYTRYYALALGICLRYSNNKEDAIGILNDGFFKVFTNIKKYDFEKPFSAWMSKIMRNTGIDFYRTKIRLGSVVDISSYEHIIIDDETISQKLNYDDLLMMVHRLPPAYRTAFNLYAIDGYKHDEISEMLGIAVGTSKSNLHKARERLAEMVRSQNSILGKIEEDN
ncbi:RNA polymerase sigma factor [Sphingobacterium sp. SRCM116780]|uniref:RNA polymerase sigma factor n=1 Tax=Sphingobacterium sp. SRCM116780 TaxID=2907623 RepID=UPI001F44EF97|nr:RNA polymerase sigma factor [Sphingobacterium sp. SRCM116780]UIR55629.1 RNA polymerase sigma factor [Sphingobacterium sp. SRCM116780]